MSIVMRYEYRRPICSWSNHCSFVAHIKGTYKMKPLYFLLILLMVAGNAFADSDMNYDTNFPPNYFQNQKKLLISKNKNIICNDDPYSLKCCDPTKYRVDPNECIKEVTFK